eukprot:m.106070 g.106070  ORF g.106070 m.106070 type:complete len:496 (-) comp12668_c0_seq10:176-1663(-)
MRPTPIFEESRLISKGSSIPPISPQSPQRRNHQLEAAIKEMVHPYVIILKPLTRIYMVYAADDAVSSAFLSPPKQIYPHSTSSNPPFSPSSPSPSDCLFVIKPVTKHEREIVEAVGEHRYVVPCVFSEIPGTTGRLKFAMQIPHFTKGSLDSYWQKNTTAPIPENEIWGMLLDMAMALQHLKRVGVVHGDIKPANILVCERLFEDGHIDGVERMQCILTDFGIAKNINVSSTSKLEGGDAITIAPEVLSRGISHQSDIWSLAASLLSMSSMYYLPDAKITPFYQNLRNDNIPQEFLEHISPTLQDTFKSMLRRNPSKRPSADDLLHCGELKKRLSRRHTLHMKSLPLVDRTYFFTKYLWLLIVAFLLWLFGGTKSVTTTAQIWSLSTTRLRLPEESVSDYTNDFSRREEPSPSPSSASVMNTSVHISRLERSGGSARHLTFDDFDDDEDDDEEDEDDAEEEEEDILGAENSSNRSVYSSHVNFEALRSSDSDSSS